MATDLAEFVGAAVGLNLLFGVPLFAAGLITAVVAFAILALEQRGYRRFELAIIALIALVGLGFVYDLFAVGHSRPPGSPAGSSPGSAARIRSSLPSGSSARRSCRTSSTCTRR